MKDIPIIFSGPMVRALLDGRKLMTRRLVTERSCEFGSIPAGKLTKLYWWHAAWDGAWRDHGFPDGDGEHRSSYLHVPCHDPDDEAAPRCDLCSDRGWAGTVHRLYPRIQPGVRLWVRESLTHVTSDPVTAEECSVHCYTASIPPGMGSANPYEPNYLFAEDGQPALPPKSIPSIHMPRWASRLTLDVDRVRIERLQDISKQDVIAEGITERDGAPIADCVAGWHEPFAKLWTGLHGAGSWETNPLVVALSFRVIRANIDAPEAMAA